MSEADDVLKSIKDDREARAAAAQSPALLFDRFGRPLLIGGEYLMDGRYLVAGIITDIKLEMDPRYPPGTYTVSIVSEHKYMIQQRQRAPELTLVNMPPAMLAPADAPPPAEATPTAAAED